MVRSGAETTSLADGSAIDSGVANNRRSPPVSGPPSKSVRRDCAVDVVAGRAGRVSDATRFARGVELRDWKLDNVAGEYLQEGAAIRMSAPPW